MNQPPIRWAILGVGQAGQRRAAAIQTDIDAELVAVWRGRFAKGVGVPVTDSAEDAIGLADAVYVCTPLDLHAAQVELALSAGRHVVTEYPLATSHAEAADLFRLAADRGVVLHVGHIELLSGVARTLTAHVRATDVRHAELYFSSSGPVIPGAELAVRNVARLHRLLAVVGSVARVGRVDVSPGEMLAELELESGRKANIAFRQGPGLPRHTILEIKTFRSRWRQVDRSLELDGTMTTVLDPGSVFESDHRFAMRRIRNGSPSYVTDERILEVLQLAEALSLGRTGPL
ncbi:MAG: Gfo/Idh/MocA family oxidoreductase [Deltaproteobacteria bacterium]|nr:MAG: Gfo/Idh/MocA family oxidoreductase [Deltaproteobacteria bacterium]